MRGEYPEKNGRSKGENQNQTQPTYGFDAGIWTQATLVGGECSHHFASLARYNQDGYNDEGGDVFLRWLI